ncbi:transcriptional regulator [Kosakonia sp. BYX6]|uniref:Transcriptional regulator n=1 Tax=Kosakonia calanthes TaxID=3139408 RepID=A0ABZ3B133_9ENTR
MYWIINENIEFRPGIKKLTSAHNPEVNVTLTTPASRCLLLLLEASPNVVLQQDFFKKVWEEEGMLVPANTLYQNISIVRRGLRAVGETDQKLIATIPRKGFQIDGGVKIAIEEEIVQPTPTSIHIINNDVQNMIPGIFDPTDEHIHHELHPASAVVPKKIPVTCNEKFRSWQISALVIVISFLAGFFSTNAIWNMNKESAFFDSYTLVESDNGCHFHTKDDSHSSNTPYLKYKSLILDSGLNCKNYPWVYFPTSLTSPTLTALVCRHEYTTKSSPGCISLYITGVNDDN